MIAKPVVVLALITSMIAGPVLAQQGGVPGAGGTPPGLDGVTPPGQGGIPPGQGGVPPGQARTPLAKEVRLARREPLVRPLAE